MHATDPFVKALAGGLRLCRVKPGDRLLLAVSGGADSMAMLIGCAALAARREWQLGLHVGHVNHHLRDTADADAAAVAGLAEQLAVACCVRDIHPPDDEAAARRQRYDALTRLADQVDADAIATAHHADDQLETLVMRLVRGSSVAGLSGIRRRRRHGKHTIIRPMLRLTHAAAVEACKRTNVQWCRDATNDDRTKWRNRLRHEVLPVLHDLRPGASIKAVEAAESIADARRIVDRHAEALLGEHVAFGARSATLDRAAARALDAGDRRLIVLSVGRKLGLGADAFPARTVRRIAAAIGGKSNETKRFELMRGLVVTIDADTVTWRQ